jgi:DNA (cytosine-5)-methyltransferase 1
MKGKYLVDLSPINTLSICSGVGGLDLGLELATNGAARPVCFVEREAFPAAILAARMEEKALDPCPIWSDLRTFDGKPWRGVVDCVTGGYPCQPFSSAGKRLGEDDPRHLWPEIRRITKEIEPRFVFFENVAGHLTLGLSDVLRDLQEMGFRCSTGLFTAEEVGAPHRRERLFILGVADGNGASRSESPNRSAERIKKESYDHGCGRKLADAARKLREWQMGSQERERLWSSRNDCGELADSESGLSRITKGGNWREGIRGTSAELANADGGRFAGCGISEGYENPCKGNEELPDFPPGPKDFDAWRRILEHDEKLAPSIESDIHRMDDGLASRVDRLRACGNGVVPLVAAYAFTTLLTCIEDNK